MAKFRKRPIVIEAEQWFPGKRIDGILLYSDKETPAWVADEHGHRYPFGYNFAVIKTLEGFLTVSPGDWVITGIQGEKYPCKPEIFDATYEPVE